MWDSLGETQDCQQLWLWVFTHHQSSAWQSLLPSSPHLMQRADKRNYESQVAASKPCWEGKERGEKGQGGSWKAAPSRSPDNSILCAGIFLNSLSWTFGYRRCKGEIRILGAGRAACWPAFKNHLTEGNKSSGVLKRRLFLEKIKDMCFLFVCLFLNSGSYVVQGWPQSQYLAENSHASTSLSVWIRVMC